MPPHISRPITTSAAAHTSTSSLRHQLRRLDTKNSAMKVRIASAGRHC